MLRTMLKALLFYSGIYTLLNRCIPVKGLYILGYHRIWEHTSAEAPHVLAVTDQNLDQHIRHVKRHYKVVTMDDVEGLLKKGKLDRDYLVFTFDDGYKDNHTLGRELFEKHGLHPTIYLTTDPVDKRTPLWTDVIDSIVFHSPLSSVRLKLLDLDGTFRLDSHSSKVALTEVLKNEIKRYDETVKDDAISRLRSLFQTSVEPDDSLIMNWDEARELASSGVDFGGHTNTHPTLSQIPLADVEWQLKESKRVIEVNVGKSVPHFAYPYGKENDYTPDVKRLVGEHYRTAVTAVDGINFPGQDRYELKRIMIDNIHARGLGIRLLKWKIKSLLTSGRT